MSDVKIVDKIKHQTSKIDRFIDNNSEIYLSIADVWCIGCEIEESEIDNIPVANRPYHLDTIKRERAESKGSHSFGLIYHTYIHNRR
jgi:hypothetical protein